MGVTKWDDPPSIGSPFSPQSVKSLAAGKRTFVSSYFFFGSVSEKADCNVMMIEVQKRCSCMWLGSEARFTEERNYYPCS